LIPACATSAKSSLVTAVASSVQHGFLSIGIARSWHGKKRANGLYCIGATIDMNDEVL
jgi:hypothetical protein